MVIVTKKALFSVIEIPLALTLLFTALFYVTSQSDPSFIGEDSLSSQELLLSFQGNDSLRSLVYGEDLSTSSLEEDWSNFQTQLDSYILTYGIQITNLTHSNVISSCSSSYSNEISTLSFYHESISQGEFRVLVLEVCK